MGRILILDDYVNITDTTMEDNYTLELPMNVKKLVKERGEVEHILIIGGGDCLILNHLASKYP
jgi:spermidine synthase